MVDHMGNAHEHLNRMTNGFNDGDARTAAAMASAEAAVASAEALSALAEQARIANLIALAAPVTDAFGIDDLSDRAYEALAEKGSNPRDISVEIAESLGIVKTEQA